MESRNYNYPLEPEAKNTHTHTPMIASWSAVKSGGLSLRECEFSDASSLLSRARLVWSRSGVVNANVRAQAANSVRAGLGALVSPHSSASIRYRKRDSHPCIEFSAARTSWLATEYSAAALRSEGSRRARGCWLDPAPQPPPELTM